MVRTFQKLAAPLARRVRLMVGRGVLCLVNDSLKLQGVQVSLLADEIRDNVERFQDYGVTSHPFPGAEAIVVSVGGSRDHAVVVRVDDRRYRPKNLTQGETAIYDDQGQMIHLKRGKKIHIYGCDELIIDAAVKATVTAPEVIVNATTKVTLNTPQVDITGALSVTGTATIQGALSSATSISDPAGSMQEMRDIYNGHTHDHPADGVTIPAPTQGMN